MNQDHRRSEMVRGLRALADMLSDTSTPLPYDLCSVAYWQYSADGCLGEPITQDIARETMGRFPGNWDKSLAGEYASYTRQMSEVVEYEISVPREQVCKRIVTGKRTIAAREVDIVEWVCE